MNTGTMDGAFRFENFVVGAPNRLAAAAARAVAETPGTTYNPLFIYGDSGLGKTHLVAAIAWHARHANASLRIELSTGEEVVERMHEAIALGRYDSFTQHYQDVDLLVLDDVQFLTGQRETQSGLLRLFNLMQSRGRQLVMTSDRQPADIPDVDQRLLSRLSGGLIVDVGTPDYEMRLAILRNACAERGLDFVPGVLEEVARLAFGNVRELKGALNRISAYCQLDGTQVTPEDVRAVLGERGRAPARTPGAVGVLRADGTIAEYDGFVADVMQEVERRVESWRVRIGDACDHWKAEGFRTAVLERALTLQAPPDVDGLLATFMQVATHLRELESRTVVLDPSLRGHAAFRDPENVDAAQALLERTIATSLPLPAPDPSYTRATFVAGNANQLALRAFDEIVEAPGARYNPLLVHGPARTGKTHLVHALANALKSARPGASVACLSITTFMQELVAAMQEGGVERWRARYRHADLLVLDDVQLLVDKERTQDELFHLFNHLVARGSQIVLTSDRPPRELIGLADRLRSRFEGGLVVTLQAAPELGGGERSASTWLEATGQVSAAAGVLGAPHIEPGHLDEALLDREKVIWDWPDLGGRLVEELR